MKKERWLWIAIIAGLLIFLWQLDTCRGRDFGSQQSKYDSLAISKQEVVKLANSRGDTIVRQYAIMTSDQEALKKAAEELFNYKSKDQKQIKRIDALVKLTTKTKLPNPITAKFTNNNFDKKKFADSLSKECSDVISNLLDTSVLVGSQFKYDSSFLQIAGTVEKDGVRIDSLNMPDTQAIAFEVTKGGLFRRGIDGKVKFWTPRKLSVSVYHSNPYIQTTGMTSAVYQSPPKGRWLERAIIFATGVFLGSRLK